MYFIPPWHRETGQTYSFSVLHKLLQQHPCNDLNRMAFVVFESSRKTRRSYLINDLANAILDGMRDKDNVIDAMLAEQLHKFLASIYTESGNVASPEQEVLGVIQFLYEVKKKSFEDAFHGMCTSGGMHAPDATGCLVGYYQSRFDSCCVPLPIPLLSVETCDGDNAGSEEIARVHAQDIFNSLSTYPRFYSVDNVVFQMETLVFLQSRCLKYLAEFIDVEFYRTIYAENEAENCANRLAAPTPSVNLTQKGLQKFGSLVRTMATFATKTVSDCVYVHGRARQFKSPSEKIAFLVVSKLKSFLTVSGSLDKLLLQTIASLLFDTQGRFFQQIQEGEIVFDSVQSFKGGLLSMEMKWPFQKLFPTAVLQAEIPDIDKLLKADELLLGLAGALPIVGSVARPVLDIFFSGLQRSLRQTIKDWQNVLASHKDRTTLLRRLIAVLDIETALASDPRCLRKYSVLHSLLTRHKKRNQTVDNVYPKTMRRQSKRMSLESFIAPE
jgi:hypothetical protein